MNITKATLKQNPNIAGAFSTEVVYNHQKINLGLDADDATIEETLLLANRILENLEAYIKKAEDIIVKDFLKNYNENWSDADNGYPELNEQEFRNNLTVKAINFLSKDGVDIFFDENGLFGHHTLIAQSFDGENFEDTTLFG